MLEQALLIDDSIPLHILMRAQLGNHWIDLKSAYNGRDGIRAASELKSGVILLDVDMPDMDGFEVCQTLKNNQTTRKIPVIFLTGDSIRQDKARGLDLGAVDYLTKPCGMPALSASVRAALRTRRADERLDMVDGLTGLWNKAYLAEHLISMTSQAIDEGKPLSCIAIEVDNLGSIDKRHGYRSGDEVMRSVSQILMKDRRPEDVVCNNGRGKFTIVISGSDRLAANRLQAGCARRCGTCSCTTMAWSCPRLAASESQTPASPASGR